MRRSLPALLLACLLASPAMIAATTTPVTKPVGHTVVKAKAKPAPKHVVTAPADEYFGHQKYSILGIRNALHDLNIRYDGTAGRVDFLYNNGAGLEDAMHDWDKKYHGDLWLAHYLFQLDQIYMRVPAAVGHQKADKVSSWIIGAYPNTYYSRYLIHIRKLRETAKAQSTPVATGVPMVNATASAAASPIAAVSPSPNPLVIPVPSATPGMPVSTPPPINIILK